MNNGVFTTDSKRAFADNICPCCCQILTHNAFVSDQQARLGNFFFKTFRMHSPSATLTVSGLESPSLESVVGAGGLESKTFSRLIFFLARESSSLNRFSQVSWMKPFWVPKGAIQDTCSTLQAEVSNFWGGAGESRSYIKSCWIHCAGFKIKNLWIGKPKFISAILSDWTVLM